MEVRNKPEITQIRFRQKENRPGNLTLQKNKHSSRRLKIAERNYCLMTVPSTEEMQLD
jgi:hypothetical protein